MTKTYRIEVTLPDVPESMVDWYQAETMSEAIAIWEEDAHRYGLPADAGKGTVSIRLATEKEAKVVEGLPNP